MIRKPYLILVALLLATIWLLPAQAQDPAIRENEPPSAVLALSDDTITYQGLLKQSGAAPTGTYDFQFSLYTAATDGSQVGSTITKDNVAVSAGLFTVQLSFGEGLFTGEERWIELAVKADASATYTTLSPRQQVTAAPLALALPGFWTYKNSTSPNLIGGYEGNSANSSAVGITIDGGGASGSSNSAYDNYSTIGGGAGNSVGSNDGTVGSDVYGVIGGGTGNTATQDYAVIGGGQGNSVTGFAATIGGGQVNTASDTYITIGGGRSNSASDDYATIAGGYGNSVSAQFGTVGGGGSATNGTGNRVYDNYGTVSGGTNNAAGVTGDTTSQPYATVAGGTGNTASEDAATVGGGSGNTASANYTTVAGGTSNTASGDTSTIGGGQLNAASGSYTTIAGGRGNTASGNISAVGGGQSNQATNTGATVGGGQTNTATGQYATVAGGVNNDATNTYTAVAGGLNNNATGAGAFVGGGQNNNASSTLSAILGGSGNSAKAPYSVALGQGAVAEHEGSFVWASGTEENERAVESTMSTGPGQFIIRAPGGAWIGTSNKVDIPAGSILATESGAFLSKGGTWSNSSDKALKSNFAAINGRDLLEKLAAIPIQSWNYTNEGDQIRHVGPTAQDFYAAFGLGSDNRHIATVDADGVALAGIQALHGLASQQAAVIDRQASEIAALDARLSALEGGAPAGGVTLPWILLAIATAGGVGWAAGRRARKDGAA